MDQETSSKDLLRTEESIGREKFFTALGDAHSGKIEFEGGVVFRCLDDDSDRSIATSLYVEVSNYCLDYDIFHLLTVYM